MNVSLRQLRGFVAVARLASFTEAAKALNLSQSAVSGLIKELELNVGVPLFGRSTRAVQLSEVGQQFYRSVERILEDLGLALDGIRSLRELSTGLVKIAAPQLMASTVVPDAIARYRRSYPGVDIRLADCSAEDAIARVLNGEVDIGIGPQRHTSPDLAAELLVEMPIIFVCRDDHPLARRQAVTWKDALEHPFIALEGNFTTALQHDLSAAPSPLALTPVNEVTSMTTALGMVRADLGVTTVPAYAAPIVRAFGLRMCRLREPKVIRRFYIFTRRNRQLSPAAERMYESMLDYWKHIGRPASTSPTTDHQRSQTGQTRSSGASKKLPAGRLR